MNTILQADPTRYVELPGEGQWDGLYYVWWPEGPGNISVTFFNPPSSIQRFCSYAKQEHLGGLFVWCASNDSPRAEGMNTIASCLNN